MDEELRWPARRRNTRSLAYLHMHPAGWQRPVDLEAGDLGVHAAHGVARGGAERVVRGCGDGASGAVGRDAGAVDRREGRVRGRGAWIARGGDASDLGVLRAVAWICVDGKWWRQWCQAGFGPGDEGVVPSGQAISVRQGGREGVHHRSLTVREVDPPCALHRAEAEPCEGTAGECGLFPV